MKPYHDLLQYILDHGVDKSDRTGTGTRSIFGYQFRFDLAAGFPMVTTKKLHLRSIIHELIWFLTGDPNIAYLTANGVSIWDEWAPQEDVFEDVELSFTERFDALAAMIMDDEAQAHLRPGCAEVLLQVMKKRLWEENKGTLRDDHFHVELDKAEVPRTRQVLVKAKGDIGPVYGKQWRSWEGADGKTVDQISWLIAELKRNPDSRRLVISAWNVTEVDQMALHPCHCLFQFYTTPLTVDERIAAYNRRVIAEEEDFNNSPAADFGFEMRTYRTTSRESIIGFNLPAHQRVEGAFTDTQFHEYLDRMEAPSRKLSCQLYQRSGDAFLGVPFNIASYAILTHMVAQVVNMEVGDFVHTFGDAHIYRTHMDQVALQLSREPFPLPTLKLNPNVKNIFDFKFEDIEVVGYQSHKAIKAPVAV